MRLELVNQMPESAVVPTQYGDAQMSVFVVRKEWNTFVLSLARFKVRRTFCVASILRVQQVNCSVH